MFEDQTVELLPARTTMKSVAHRGASRVVQTINLTFVFNIINFSQVSTGSYSPNTALVIIANG